MTLVHHVKRTDKMRNVDCAQHIQRLSFNGKDNKY